MTLYGALYSGVSGLMAQSSAMGAIADNIANVNTVGYKNTNVKFQTLVTKQTSLSSYSTGGVQARPFAAIGVQGLLMGTESTTDLGISGAGFFVVNEAANPTLSDMWAFSRAGSFSIDEQGYLKNTGSYYLQGWSLMPYDGNPNATVVEVNGFYYMKAYKDPDGKTVYVNDNIIDSKNLKPINLMTIGGDATPTRQIRMGANLPASDPIFDEQHPELGGRHSVSTLVYDSLGNSHNVNFQYTKISNNSWSCDVKIPDGAANIIVYSGREVADTPTDDVYSARGQLEFTKLPSNHSYVKITDDPTAANPVTYVYEFSTDGTTSYVPSPGEKVVQVDIQVGVVAVSEAVRRLQTAIYQTLPGGGRFVADWDRIDIDQSVAGNTLVIDASKCLECKQANANPNLLTGIPMGIYEIPQISWSLKNAGRLDFASTDLADYIGHTVTLGNNTYEFTLGGGAAAGNVEVNITGACDETPPGSGVYTLRSRAGIVEALKGALTLKAQDPSRFITSGTSLLITQSTTGDDIMVGIGDSSHLTFGSANIADYEGFSITLDSQTYVFTSTPSGTNPLEVDISGIIGGQPDTATNIMYRLLGTIKNNPAEPSPSRFQGNGSTLITSPGLLGASTVVGTTSATSTGTANNAISGIIKAENASGSVALTSTAPSVLHSSFMFNNVADAEDGSKAPAVRFNSDGTPKYFNLKNMSIAWANGAQNMNGSPDEGAKITLFAGNENTADGLTHLAGSYVPNYVTQDGARFGSYSGVSIDKNGLVTALFDNGETRPVGMVPLATFTNPSGMGALTGNVWIETDYSGAPTLRQASDANAGAISSSSLENSTVDLATEFTNMIMTQRAYSAAAKIITTSDEMLDTLMTIKR